MIVIFTALGGAGVVFLLYALYQFRKEEQCMRAAMRARRSVVVEEINPEVAPMKGGPGLKLGDNDKFFVIRLETPDRIPGARPFAGLSSQKLASS